VFPWSVAIALSLAIYLAASSISDIKQEHSGVPLVAQDIVFAGQDAAFVTPMSKLHTPGFYQVAMHSPVYGGGFRS